MSACWAPSGGQGKCLFPLPLVFTEGHLPALAHGPSTIPKATANLLPKSTYFPLLLLLRPSLSSPSPLPPPLPPPPSSCFPLIKALTPTAPLSPE